MSTNHPEAPQAPEPDLLPPKPIPVHPASALAVLTPDEREQLFDWLETLPIHEVLAKVAAPRPHGFAIQTHVTTLRRFHTRARAHAQRQIAEDAAYINEIENPSPDFTGTLLERVTGSASLELLLTHPNNLAHFKAVSRFVLKQQELKQEERRAELAQRRLELKERRLEFEIRKQELKAALAAARVAARQFNSGKPGAKKHTQPRPDTLPSPQKHTETPAKHTEHTQKSCSLNSSEVPPLDTANSPLPDRRPSLAQPHHPHPKLSKGDSLRFSPPQDDATPIPGGGSLPAADPRAQSNLRPLACLANQAHLRRPPVASRPLQHVRSRPVRHGPQNTLQTRSRNEKTRSQNTLKTR